MRRAILAFAVVVGTAALVAGTPSMAFFDERPDSPGSSVDANSGPIDLEFIPRARDEQRVKPRPKHQARGRENPNGLQSACTNDGFLMDFFGLAGILRTCPEEQDRRLGLRF